MLVLSFVVCAKITNDLYVFAYMALLHVLEETGKGWLLGVKGS